MGDVDPVWTPDILSRLREWQSWAHDTVELHYRRANVLGTRVLLLGISAVVLSTFSATFLFAFSSGFTDGVWVVGALTAVAAAVAAALHTFLPYGEEAEEHRQIAERWAGLRREIAEVLALHPDYRAREVDPERYVEDLRVRIEDASAKGRLIETGRWREIAERQRLDFRTATIAAAGKRVRNSPRPAERGQSLFTPVVRQLLEDWERRAAASSGAHVAVGQRLASLNTRLGVSTMALLTADAALLSVLRGTAPPSSRFVVGIVATLAASLASINTFLRTTERAAKHGLTAETWETLRSEIGGVTRDPPRRVQEDPKAYLDDLRRQMDELSAVSPEVDDRAWARALAGEARRPTFSTTDAADRFASLFPGVNLRVEDETMEAAR